MNAPRTTPPHPLMLGDLNSPSGYGTALDHCVDTLYLLADLFTGPADKQSILDNDRARNGMFLQLMGIADVLKVLSAIDRPKND